jgi:hypothetical protein
MRTLKAVKATVQNWFRKTAKTPSAANAWTTFKDAKSSLSGARYAKGFIPCNTKATNDHAAKKSLAYLCNVFHHPIIKGYFEKRQIRLHEDIHALSEMIQWIWRSQIRRGDPIAVFIPSERMRSLFKQWLYSANSADLIGPEFKQAA